MNFGMLYHIVVTPDCNLACEYCLGKAFDEPENANDEQHFEAVPREIQYSMKALSDFLARDKDKEGIYLTFYGGEPLLNIKDIKKIMDEFKANPRVKGFMMQTNGMLLQNLSPEYLNRFHTILVSIDGGKEITNKNRGRGTYEAVIANLKRARENGFRGEIIARMTIEEHNAAVPTSPIIECKHITPEDQKMAARQLQFDQLTAEEQKEQDLWARFQMAKHRGGICLAGFNWYRVKGGYRCHGGHHALSDEIMAEGRDGYFTLWVGGLNRNHSISLDGQNWCGPVYARVRHFTIKH